MVPEKKLTEEQRKQVLDEILPSMIEHKLSLWRGDDITGTDRNMRGSILLWLKDKFNLWNDKEFEEVIENECPGSVARRMAMEEAGFSGYRYNAHFEIHKETIKFSFLKEYLSSLMAKGLAGEEPSLLAPRLKELFQYETNFDSYLSMIKAISLGELLSIDDLFECSTLRCPDTIFVKRLGQGRGGTTYKVYSENLQQYRVIKILNSSRVNPEARLMAKLSGKDLDHIVQIHDAGTHLVTVGRKKACVILMEYVDGQTLGEILTHRGFTPREVLGYSEQMLLGIQSLKKYDITHRDLNLHNVKVNTHRKIKFLDFGIATDESHPSAKDARRCGVPSNEEANDLFSLGMLTYQMTTGEHLVYHRKPEEKMSSSAYGDYIDKMKQTMYSLGKLNQEYKKKIKEMPFRFGSEEVGYEYGLLSAIAEIVLSCFETPTLEMVKSSHVRFDEYLSN